MQQNSILVYYNLETREYEIVEKNILRPEVTFYFGFKDSNEVKTFNNLAFGVVVQNEEKDVIYLKNWPGQGSKYVSTDQEFIEIVHFILESGKNYRIFLWTEESGIRRDKIYTISTPEFEQYPDYEVE